MKYIDGFRHADTAGFIRKNIDNLGEILNRQGKNINIMEICGGHTTAIARFGIRGMLPQNVNLISGPGCPVCVTDTGYIDAAVDLAMQGGVIMATFGDMMRVPGTTSNLTRCRAEGAEIKPCYSPASAIDLAQKYPDREIVFLGIGFETTTVPVICMIDRAVQEGIRNLSVLTAFKRVPPVLDALVTDPELRINAFLCPGHVSAIIGSNVYNPFADKYFLPCVVAGFEPIDILYGLEGILKQVTENRPAVMNQYNRVVKPEGNPAAKTVVETYLKPVDASWRGMGTIPESGLKLRPEYEYYDAEKRHGIRIQKVKENNRCQCGEVLKGKIRPPECRLFGTGCTPEHPVGPCMVSSEGSCAAYFIYGSKNSG